MPASSEHRIQRRQKSERVRIQCQRVRRAEGCHCRTVVRKTRVRGVAGD